MDGIRPARPYGDSVDGAVEKLEYDLYYFEEAPFVLVRRVDSGQDGRDGSAAERTMTSLVQSGRLEPRSATQEANDGQEGRDLKTGQPEEMPGSLLIERAELARDLLIEQAEVARDLLIEQAEVAVDFRVQISDRFPQLTDPASVLVHLRLDL